MIIKKSEQLIYEDCVKWYPRDLCETLEKAWEEIETLKTLLFKAQEQMGEVVEVKNKEFFIIYTEIHALFYEFDSETEDFKRR